MDSWFTSLALAFGLAHRKEQKKEQQWQVFLDERKQDLCALSGDLFETLNQLVATCGPVGLPKDFIEDSKLASLYAIGEVLSAQGMIFPEQESYLKIWICNLNPMINYVQFEQAAIQRTGVYEKFQEIVGLTEKTCGTFWLTLLEASYRSRRFDLLQELCDNLIKIVWNFSYLAGKAAPFAETISKRITANYEYWANAYQQTPYIHALMLLQNKLRDQKELPIEKQLLLRDQDIRRDDRDFFVFDAYERQSEEDFGAFYGKYAVKALRSAGKKLDYEHDSDLILCRQEASQEFEVFYDELIQDE